MNPGETSGLAAEGSILDAGRPVPYIANPNGAEGNLPTG